MKVHFEQTFFPVGQGLCTYGVIGFSHPNSDPEFSLGAQSTADTSFRWVYDCGSITNNRLVSNAISLIEIECGSTQLDLLVLSHFHNDHISGTIELLQRVGTKILLLPWAPLWHRLMIGFGQGFLSDDDETLFFVDPVKYIIEKAPGRVSKFLFVMPSSGETPPYPYELSSEVPDFKEGEEATRLDGGESASAVELQIADQSKVTIEKLLPGKALLLNAAWEFVPYNDPTTKPSDHSTFESIVKGHLTALLRGDDTVRKAALKDLRDIYNSKFKGAVMNDASLFLYGGTIHSASPFDFAFCYQTQKSLKEWHFLNQIRRTTAGVLLTGDGNLSTPEKWDRAVTYFKQERLSDLLLFQVPHHGARSSWHEGLAAKVAPAISVFCSDPHHKYGHPNAVVLRDFWSFNPVQVDQHSGFVFSLW